MESKWSPAWVTVVVGVVLFAVGAYFGLNALLRSGIGMDGLAAKQTQEARLKLAKATNDSERCDPLATIAKDDFNRGKIDEARKYATQLLAIAGRIGAKDDGKSDFEYGIAVHDGNMVLGRIALSEKKLDEAKQYLLKAGTTPGAATLDSFGPNMSLANDLLAAGQRDTVIQYFHECRRFWNFNPSTLNSWEAKVKSGGMPDFGANLYY